MEPQIRFCTSADGTRIAYATMGKGPPLVNFPGWGYRLEADLNHPDSRLAHEKLAAGRLLVNVERRGIGASQREVEAISLETGLADLAAVADHLGLDSFDLFGSLDGAAVCVAYAGQYPERVSRLVLFSAYPCGVEFVKPGAVQGLQTLIREDWRLALRALASVVFPSGPSDLQRWWSRTSRESLRPETAAKYLDFTASVDVRPFLQRVEAPTLVLHRRGDRDAPIASGRAVAALIRDARFAILDGDIGHMFLGDVSYLDSVTQFLDQDREQALATEAAAGTFRAVLFTDLVGHTEMMSRLGDERGRKFLREHERITREMLAAHGGTEVKTMGDGFMASFGSVTKAVECSIALQRAFAKREGEPLSVRVGLNAGEPIEEEGDLFGATVILASRMAAMAGGGEILVSDNVRSLSAGKGFLFSDRGDFAAKGFEEPVRVYDVRWRTDEAEGSV